MNGATELLSYNSFPYFGLLKGQHSQDGLLLVNLRVKVHQSQAQRKNVLTSLREKRLIAVIPLELN